VRGEAAPLNDGAAKEINTCCCGTVAAPDVGGAEDCEAGACAAGDWDAGDCATEDCDAEDCDVADCPTTDGETGGCGPSACKSALCAISDCPTAGSAPGMEEVGAGKEILCDAGVSKREDDGLETSALAAWVTEAGAREAGAPGTCARELWFGEYVGTDCWTPCAASEDGAFEAAALATGTGCATGSGIVQVSMLNAVALSDEAPKLLRSEDAFEGAFEDAEMEALPGCTFRAGCESFDVAVRARTLPTTSANDGTAADPAVSSGAGAVACAAGGAPAAAPGKFGMETGIVIRSIQPASRNANRRPIRAAPSIGLLTFASHGIRGTYKLDPKRTAFAGALEILKSGQTLPGDRQELIGRIDKQTKQMGFVRALLFVARKFQVIRRFLAIAQTFQNLALLASFLISLQLLHSLFFRLL